jgi:type II secretory pathway component PulF
MLQSFITSSLALLMMGLCLQVSLRLLYGARGPSPDDSVYFFMRILSWGLLLIPAGILFVAGANWLSVVLFAALFEAIFELVLGRRSNQRHAAWRLMSSALGGGRAVVDSLRFHQVRFTGVVGRWYRRLVGDLERGVGWPEAIWSNRRALPREAPALAGVLDFGTGPLGDDYKLDDAADVSFQIARQQLIQGFVYLATVTFIMTGVMIFTMTRVVPAYQQIFGDFDLSLPRITEHLIRFSRFFESFYGVILVLVVAGIALAALCVGVCYLADLPVLQPVTDRLMMWSAYPSPYVRRRLRDVKRRVDRGQPWHEALERTRLINSSDAGVLVAAQQAGNLPWAMRMLAGRKMRLTAFRWTIAQQILFTVVVLMFGLFVLWVGVAMLFPIADLIKNLSM